jgi:hypothetical protein
MRERYRGHRSVVFLVPGNLVSLQADCTPNRSPELTFRLKLSMLD